MKLQFTGGLANRRLVSCPHSYTELLVDRTPKGAPSRGRRDDREVTTKSTSCVRKQWQRKRNNEHN
ncbi:hypothetical protein E2562_015821 [Oryza meyeriana var. granulata]|uniref:Uncharacterized protein n=1 Tax=Oryza meyeriana var. granulata TaxID=110450 RepID=A0A6G1D4K1_9ORYZ|nr:hypothetical protein E2562_015821 [Oryza meyeriana var. granulata]